MRNLFEFREDFPKMPEKYPYDEDSGLFMNLPNQWSKSPYLGAVKSKAGSEWVAQIHIPQEVWEYVIRDNAGKWGKNLPDSFWEENGNNRSTIRVNVNDPRKAAWIVQTILYGDYDTAEMIDEYLTTKYIHGKKGLSAWTDVIQYMPKFDGAPLTLSDREEFFTNLKARDTQSKLDKNKEAFFAKAPAKIKQTILAKAAQGSVRKKIFGTGDLSLNELGPIIDRAIEELGVSYFLQGIHVKDPLGFDLSKFVDKKKKPKTEMFKEGFRSGYLNESTSNPYTLYSEEWVEWQDGFLQGDSIKLVD